MIAEENKRKLQYILTLTLLTILCPTVTIVVLLAMKYIYLTYVSRIKEKRTNIEIPCI